MASASFYSSSADSPDCDPCKHEGKENEAKWHYGTCREYMCHECHGAHGQLGMSKNHVTNILVPLQGPDNDRSSGKTDTLNGEVSGKRQLNDGNKERGITHYGQVSGRRRASTKSSKGNTATQEGKVSSKLVTDVKHMSIGTTFGTSRSSPGVPASSSTSRCSPGVPSSSSHPTFSSAIIVNQFDASYEDDDQPCCITGALVMEDLIILADVDNNKIKVFNKQDFNFIIQTRVEEAYDLTDISDDTIAVTSGCKKYFTLFSLNDEALTEIRKVNTSYYCWGICHHDELIYVVCQEKATGVAEVDVFTLEGEMKRRFEPLSQGLKVLQNPVYITINLQTETLYIEDLDTSAVIGLSHSGKVVFNQTVPCKTATGVAVDDQGQLYVCGLNSHNIIRMSPDGMTSEVLVTKDIRYPQCLHVHGNELILGCQKINIVRIYKLS